MTNDGPKRQGKHIKSHLPPSTLRYLISREEQVSRLVPPSSIYSGLFSVQTQSNNRHHVHEGSLLHLQLVSNTINLRNEQSLIHCPTDKVTWWGCGSHIPSVMDSVPESERCACEPKVEKDGKMYPPKAANAA
ncbi:hypothetical protein N7510_010056 [Penicillium lagena]|uniref:uncharacterized protein n=1 Tax=Penicillium lagena TaxID=94218 RepID=UPI002540F4CA|nr:uncharacterized protein N7510_010056 [Penicillium lagena]KAJ5604902.1 hypothetical protein N7510_010056 [Penicillium lagena]